MIFMFVRKLLVHRGKVKKNLPYSQSPLIEIILTVIRVVRDAVGLAAYDHSYCDKSDFGGVQMVSFVRLLQLS